MILRRILLFAMLLSGAAFSQQRPAAMLEALSQVSRNVPEMTRAGLIREKYRFLFPRREYKALSDAALRERFDAAEVAAFYSYDKDIVQEMADLLAELKVRKAAKSSDFQAMVGSFILTRQFDRAKALQSTLEDARGLSVPQVVDAPTLDRARPSVLLVEERKLIRKNPELGTAYVVIVAHPLCHFTQNASKAISSDPRLGAELGTHALWLVPPERGLRMSLFEEWNAAHPNQQMMLAYDVAEWPQIASWSTPTFYFFRNGKLVEKVVGWPSDGSNLEVLRKAVSNFRKNSVNHNGE